jgi:hypothetical protein
LKTNSLIDLTGFVYSEMGYIDAPSSFVRDVAFKMERIGEYEVIEIDNWNRFYVKTLPEKLLRDRKPLVFQFIVIMITILVSSVATVIVQGVQNRQRTQEEFLQEVHLSRLSDSLKTLQIDLHALIDSEKNASYRK